MLLEVVPKATQKRKEKIYYTFIFQAIKWLRGEKHDIDGEIKALENSQKKGQGGGDTSTCTELSKPSTLKPFLILIGVFVLMQLTGTYAVIFYAVTVFRVSKVLRVVSIWGPIIYISNPEINRRISSFLFLLRKCSQVR